MQSAIRMAAWMRHEFQSSFCQIDYRSWHFFVNRHHPGIWCAIAFKAKVPAFLMTRHWRYCRSDACATLGLHFDATIAKQGAKINGFYLFHDLQTTSRILTAVDNRFEPFPLTYAN